MRRCGVEGSGGVGSRRRSLSSFAERGLEEQRGPWGGQGVDCVGGGMGGCTVPAGGGLTLTRAPEGLWLRR